MSLTHEEVTKIVACKLQHSDFKVTDFKIGSLFGVGLMGTHLKLKCHIFDEKSQSNKEEHFFVKGIADMPEFGMFPVRTFRKERAVYEAFRKMNIDLINESIARCYYSDDKYLVFDDLAVDGYAIRSTRDEVTFKHLEVMLKTLADIHAGSIIWEEQQSKLTGKKCRVNEAFPDAFEEVHMDFTLPNVQQWHRGIERGLLSAVDVFGLTHLKNGKLFKDEVKRMWDVIECTRNLSRASTRNVFCHVDLWAGNVMLRQNGDGIPQHAKIVDYQITRYLPPAFDVLLVILLHSSRKFRESFMGLLLVKYHDFFKDNLAKHGVDPDSIYTFDRFLETMQIVEFPAVFIAISAVPLVFIEREKLGQLSSGADYASIVLEDRTPLWTWMKDDEFYMERVKDTILDFKDFLEGTRKFS